MVCIREEHCDACERVTHHINGRCRLCETKAEKAREALWESKPVNERLIELLKRVEDLERTCVREPIRC